MSKELISVFGPIAKGAPEKEIRERISLLAGEIDANEEENRMMQQEIDALYAEIDGRKG